MVTPEEIGQIGVFACLDTADREHVCRVAADITLSAGEFAATRETSARSSACSRDRSRRRG